MASTNIEYLERFLRDIDKLESGSSGAVSGDRWLISNYSSERLRLLTPYLKHRNPVVKADLISFFASVRERSVIEDIREMKKSEGDLVGMACVGYLSMIEDDDEAIPILLDEMNHTRGDEYFRAASRMAVIARKQDLVAVRKIYGETENDMKVAARSILEKIIARNPELKSKEALILSDPVYPDEFSFEKFLDKSVDYLDVRYRRNILPRSNVPVETYNNVARALKTMRIRLYNEADNLQYYGPDKADRFEELSTLIVWANEDLSKKKVLRKESEGPSRRCPKCGELLVSYKGLWSCPDCGSVD